MPFPAFFLDKDSSLFFQVQLSSMVYTWSHMNFMPFGQLKSFLKILIEVQYHQEQIPMKEGTL